MTGLVSHSIQRRESIAVKVGSVTVGGDAPIVVQSMTNTDTADAEGTAAQTDGSAGLGQKNSRRTSWRIAAFHFPFGMSQ